MFDWLLKNNVSHLKLQSWPGWLAPYKHCKHPKMTTLAWITGSQKNDVTWKHPKAAVLSPFLIGRMFLREPSWKYSSKLYSGSKNLRSTCSGNICPIGRSLPLIGWEQSSPVNEEKEKEKKIDDGVASFFTRFGGNLFICWLVEGAALSRRPRMRL